MKYLLLAKVAFIIAATINSNANAALIEFNDSIFGTDSITRDTDTNLDWLDLEFTTNQSFKQVSIRILDSNDDLFGFRYATSAELNALFFTSGNITLGNQSPIEPSTYSLMSLVDSTLYGSLYETTQSRGYFDDGNLGDGKIGYAFISASEVLGYSSAAVINNAAFDNLQTASNASWLVKDIPLPVPAPPAILLFATSLFGLFGIRIKQSGYRKNSLTKA